MSKDLHFQEMARVEMPYHIYKKLRYEEEYEELRLLSVKDTSINYSESKEWTEANEALREAAINRKEIEEQIRVEKHTENDT
mgnify:CR=1 FL=1